MLNRALLRLSAVMALKNATLAAERVYDSQLGDFTAAFSASDYVPFIRVYTDDDSRHGDEPTFYLSSRTATLVIECAVMVRSGKAGEYTYGEPATDSELELTLDGLEMQIVHALEGESDAADLFKSVINKISKVESKRGTSEDKQHRFAARQIIIDAEILRDLPPNGTVRPLIVRLITLLQADAELSGHAPVIETLAMTPGAQTANARLAQLIGASRDEAQALGLDPAVTEEA